MVKPQRFPWWLTASLVVALLVVVGILYPSTINSTLGDADVFSSQNPMLRTLMIFYIVQGSFLPMIA